MKDKLISDINKAEQIISKLDKNVMAVSGFSSPRVKSLLNNIVNAPDVNYLEVGTFKGSTFVAALYKNEVNSAYAIDNWSEFNEYGNIKNEFLENTQKFDLPKFSFIEENCFNVDLSLIKHKINVFFFDGEHTYESHYNALKYYLPVLDDEFIFIVDDFDPYNESWAAVEKGTRDSIRDLKLETIFEKHIQSNGRNADQSWWNGIYVAILKKQ